MYEIIEETEMKNAVVQVNRAVMTKDRKREMRAAADSVDVRSLPRTKIVASVFTSDKAAQRNIPYGVLFMICIFTIAALFITFLGVRVNEVNNEISTLNSRLADIREQTADAKAEIFEKKDITAIRTAAEEMGMVRSEYLPAHYITVEAEDKVTVYAEAEETTEYTITTLLSAFGSSITSFIEYIR